MSLPSECFECGAQAPDTEQIYTTDTGDGQLRRRWSCLECRAEWVVEYERTGKEPVLGTDE